MATEFEIADESLTGLKDKVVIVTGKKIESRFHFIYSFIHSFIQSTIASKSPLVLPT